ncbi:hypothetical protein EMCRGX_G000051 [Ephydatia muelleri]
MVGLGTRLGRSGRSGSVATVIGTETIFTSVDALATEGILGMDFLRQHRCTIDYPGDCSLHAHQGITVPLQRSDCSSSCYPVRLVQTVKISPRSEIETVGEYSVPLPDCHKRLWLLEGWPQKSNVLGARSLLESSGTNISIRLCNPTDKPITLYRTLKVGMMEEVEENQSDCKTRQYCSIGLFRQYSHLQHLVNSASKHLTSSQKEALTSLLVKYSDIFPTPQEPQGRTSMLHQSISTGLMSLVFSGFQWSSCLVYLDDMIVMGKTFEEHLKNLDLVFSCIREAASAKEVQQFLGLANYYRRFIWKFAHIAKPLHKLTECTTSFNWTSEYQQSFEHLRNHLFSPPVLSYPNFKLPFLLDTDASNDAMGAVLSQLDEQGNEHAGVGIQQWPTFEPTFCMGHRFTLGTDHAPLNWLYGVKEPEGQVAEQLQELNFKIIHRPDQRYQNADTLSRSPCRQCGHTGEDDTNNESATITTLQLSSYVSANIKDNEMEDQELQLIITAKQFNESIAPAQQAAQTLQLHLAVHQVFTTNSWFHDACEIIVSKKFMKVNT